MSASMTPLNAGKKVCVIIPVYNAEKFLGYCLNSVLSQTYVNWTAILVDDGSSDSSLEICRRYEKLDGRFKVIAKKNGGVSSARNAALAAAEGDYLEFLDSDDCLAPDALEKQIGLAAEYDSQLVVMNTMIVDFNNPEGDRLELTSNWLKKSPCVLSASEFKAVRMRLIWYTALLEACWMKLYDMALWKKLNLKFPEDMSLGEDFVTNMKYYAACNGAVFLNECGYYYNQYMGSGSLTEKYRTDLFEVKMRLMDELDKHLGGRSQLSGDESDAFYCYVASSGFTCVEKAVLNSGLTGDKLLARVREMLVQPLFAEGMRHASYIPERFVQCAQLAQSGDFEGVIRYIADGEYEKSLARAAAEAEAKAAAEKAKAEAAAQEAEKKKTAVAAKPAAKPAPAPVPRSGIVNRGLRKVMRCIRPAFGRSAAGDRISRWEDEFRKFGLKHTFRLHSYRNKKVTRFMLECQTADLAKRIGGVDKRVSDMKNRAAETENGLKDLAAELHDADNKIEKSIREADGRLARHIQEIDNRVIASSDQIWKLTDRVGEVSSHLYDTDGKIGEVSSLLHTVDAKADTAIHDISEMDNRVKASAACMWEIYDKVGVSSSRIQEVDERLSNSVDALRADINGYIWNSEQRLNQYAYRRDINELRQRKKALMLATAEHANIGDAAITLAEQQLIYQQFPEYFQVEISTYEFEGKEAFLHAILNPDDIIFINGGGNMGDKYPEEEELHRRIVSEFPGNRIVIMPQTISFSNTESGKAELEKSARIYNGHNNLTIFVRGGTSLELARRSFGKARSVLMPDVVHALRSGYAFERSGVLLCLREDEEGILNGAMKEDICRIALERAGSIERRNNMHSGDISREIRGLVVRRELMSFAKRRVVITDRLHGMIFAAITGTPCVVMSSFNHKIREYYEAFFSDSNAVFFIGADVEKLGAALDMALNVEDARYPIFDKGYHDGLREIAMTR